MTLRSISIGVLLGWGGIGGAAGALSGATDPASAPPPFRVPEGYTVEVAAAAPLVGFPMLGGFDERGRLFLAESAGHNLGIEELERRRPNFIRMLEDTDGDGRFDRSTIFADRLQIPNGALWHEGALYVAEPPGIWRFTDLDGDGVADRREHIAGNVRSNGMSSTLHGPILGPTGRLFWCSGQQGYALDKDAEPPPGRIVPGVFGLRTDGSEHEVFAAGGYANPVEVAFNDTGDIFGTIAVLDRIEGQRHDGYMHWIYGGVYAHNPSSALPLRRTGDLLPPLVSLGQVAPAGIAHYRGTHLGSEVRGNVFFAEFNTHRVIRSRLTRAGAGFTAENEDFLVSSGVDFHPTDVIEDADGSLLVVDTGGWFRHGCPTSQIARPEIRGAIYRIRRIGGPVPADPRGLRLAWNDATPAALVARLDDARPVVRERAIATLATLGDRAVPDLQAVVTRGATPAARRGAVWALSRIGTPPAWTAVARGLADADASVRQAAVHAIGVERARAAAAESMLGRLVVDDSSPAVRREAAMALGRLGATGAVPQILAGLASADDVFLRHALVYALIELQQPDATVAGLSDANPRVQEGTLAALVHLDAARLPRERVVPLLNARDFEVRRAALALLATRPAWAGDMAQALRGWLAGSGPQPADREFLRDALQAHAASPLVQAVVTEFLRRDETPAPVQQLLIEVVARAELAKLPEPWQTALEHRLREGSSEVRLAAVAAVRERRLREFDATLRALTRDDRQPAAIRFAAMETLGRRLKPVDEAIFAWLPGQLRPDIPPDRRLVAARILGILPWSDAQLEALAGSLDRVDPLTLPAVLRAFHKTTADPVGRALIASLDGLPAAENISAEELGAILRRFSPDVQAAGEPLLRRLGVDPVAQGAKLESLAPLEVGGDFSRGKQVFFGEKAACLACHRVRGQGGLLGPNLTEIGDIRTARDLLESIVFPSASIVQGYESVMIETKDGQTFAGLVVRQSPEAVWLRGVDQTEIRIDAGRIASFRESPQSLMPPGYASTLEPAELRDLLAFLQGLKRMTATATDD